MFYLTMSGDFSFITKIKSDWSKSRLLVLKLGMPLIEKNLNMQFLFRGFRIRIFEIY